MEDDDWETKFEKGEVKTLSDHNISMKESVRNEEKDVRRELPLGMARGVDAEMENFVVVPKRTVPNDSRPETTTVVARRFLAHALQKPELIRRKEEAELIRKREQNKKERADRRKELDAVWEQ